LRNRPIDGIDYDGLEFVKYDKSYKSTIVIQRDRDPIMEAQNRYAMQAKMNVLVAGTLKEANQYMKEKGTKYDALLFAGHGNTVTSSISLEGRGYDAASIDAYKQDIKNLAGYVRKDGSIILLGCFQSTPQYEEKNIPSVGGETVDIKMNGEDLVKKFSATVNRNVVANREATKISYDMFDGTVPQSIKLKQNPTHSYANLNNKYAGQWTLTTPDGKHTVIGTITFNPEGSYKITPTHSNNNNSNGSTNNNAYEKKKPTLPPPSGD
jgi:hypothetical protein